MNEVVRPMVDPGRDELVNRLFHLPTDRVCDCRPNNLGCSSAKDWARSQIVVWKFWVNGKDTGARKIHPATFPIALPSKIISLFSHKGELVLDPFVGSGSTLVAAQNLERSAIGFDLQKKYVDYSNGRLGPRNFLHPELRQVAIMEDCRNASRWIRPESVKLILTSPPYSNMLMVKRKNKSLRVRRNNKLGRVEQYSDDPRDLGTMDIEKYEEAIREIFVSLHPLVMTGGQVLINVSDFSSGGERILVHVSTINATRKAGFRLKNIIIWDKTNLMNRIGIFGYPSNFLAMGAYEFILHFEKL